MHLVDIGDVANHIDGLERPKVQVIVPGEMLGLGNGAPPGNQEDLVTLSDGIFNE